MSKITKINPKDGSLSIVTIKEVFNEIATGKYKDLILKYKDSAQNDDEEATEYLLHQFTKYSPSATFSEKIALSCLDNYNNIVCVELAYSNELELNILRTLLEKEKYVYSFYQNTDNSLMVFVEVTGTIETHVEMVTKVVKYIKKYAGSDLVRGLESLTELCYISYDPQLYLNKKSIVFGINPDVIRELNGAENMMGDTIEVAAQTQTENNLSNNKINSYLHKWKQEIPDVKTNSKYLASLEEMIEINDLQPPIPYLWSGIKEGSFGFIFGPSKSGKTTIAENLGLSIAIGLPTFFNKEINGGIQKVLIISLEEYWRPRTERNKRQLMEFGLDPENNLILVTEHFPRIINTKEAWELLIKIIEDSNAKVVVIDSLSRLYSGSIEDSSLAKELLLKLREICNHFKITLIVIHHTPKQMGKPLNIDSLAGSRLLAQDADFMIGISRTQEGVRYLKEVAFRYAQEGEKVTTFTINENSWAIPVIETSEASLLSGSDGREDTSNSDLIFDEIRELTERNGFADTRVLLKEFVDSGAMSKPTLFSNINKLIRNGMVEKVDKGIYRVK